MKGLAEEAGVSEALLFKHFPNKEALYSAMQTSCCHGKDPAIERLADSRVRHALGSGARERVVQRFSWERHCVALDHAIRTMVEGKSATNPGAPWPSMSRVN